VVFTTTNTVTSTVTTTVWVIGRVHYHTSYAWSYTHFSSSSCRAPFDVLVLDVTYNS
jgi:hypothetical protein